jgi:DNA-binding response OmpR family regulator
MPNVLVIEDAAQTLDEIVEALTDHGCAVDTAQTGREGLMLAIANAYDAIVLDRMLPGGLEGLGMLASLRSAGVVTPVLILSALSAVDERVRGLRAGGDDYLTKPFASEEMAARLEVLLRRKGGPAPETLLRVGDLELDLVAREARFGGGDARLLPTEFKLLEFFMRNAGQLLTRTMIFESVWGYYFDPGTNLVDVHLGRLRRKLDALGAPPLIHTVRGSGYTLRAPA